MTSVAISNYTILAPESSSTLGVLQSWSCSAAVLLTTAVLGHLAHRYAPKILESLGLITTPDCERNKSLSVSLP